MNTTTTNSKSYTINDTTNTPFLLKDKEYTKNIYVNLNLFNYPYNVWYSII